MDKLSRDTGVLDASAVLAPHPELATRGTPSLVPRATAAALAARLDALGDDRLPGSEVDRLASGRHHPAGELMAGDDRVRGQARSVVGEDAVHDLQVRRTHSDVGHLDEDLAGLRRRHRRFLQHGVARPAHDHAPVGPIEQDILPPDGILEHRERGRQPLHHPGRLVGTEPDDLVGSRPELTGLPGPSQVNHRPRADRRQVAHDVAGALDPQPLGGQRFAEVPALHLSPGFRMDMVHGGLRLGDGPIARFHPVLDPLNVLEPRQRLVERAALPQVTAKAAFALLAKNCETIQDVGRSSQHPGGGVR